MTALALYEGKSLDLIRRTVAKDANNDELDQFVHICRAVRLDPLRRQAYCFVFGKNGDPKYRTMTVVTAIGGYRAIADRTGCYRPDDKPCRIEYSETAKDPRTNPLGIVRAEVTVYKHSHGEWHAAIGEAHWDEYVPLRDGAIDAKKTGWTKMPRIMIAKVAEASALRKAWPDDFAGLEIEEEIDRRQVIDITPSEMADASSVEAKLALVGGKDAVTVQWDMNSKLDRVPLGKLADKALEWASAKDRTETEMRIWWNNNVPARTEFKAVKGGEYLDFHKAWMAKTEAIERRNANQTEVA
jgi:phage recombination protein Bet